MGMTQRIYQIHQLLESRRYVTKQDLMDRLEISWATLKRDLTLMRDEFNAPIIYDRELGGYRFDTEEKRLGPQYELPGLWFSAEEIHALLTMQHLLSNLDSGGLLGPHIQPLLSKLAGLLGTADDSAEEVKKRIRIETVGARHVHLDQFQVIGSALLRRKRLVIRYHARGTDETTEREISPQRLVYYRDNWYLDAWCHLRNGLRNFAVDAIQVAELLDTSAKDEDEAHLNVVLGSGYGIFSGSHVHWAILRFSAERSRWVAAERWHPQQEGRYLSDGRYELKVPYADDREIIMDVLKYGADCEVVEPPELASRVVEQFRQGLAAYGRESGNSGR
jgi:predicted DNA-binding transcriptional regulator YafY